MISKIHALVLFAATIGFTPAIADGFPIEQAADWADTGSPQCRNCVTVPSLTPVSLEILAELGSMTSKSGDTFPIRLSAPVAIDGNVVIPAGIEGMGEVIHAKRSGGMGAAGELVLAARYVNLQGKQIRLRSMRLAAVGESKIDRVSAMSVASAAAFAPLSLLGFAISGGEVIIPSGTTTSAKTAETTVWEVAPAKKGIK